MLLRPEALQGPLPLMDVSIAAEYRRRLATEQAFATSFYNAVGDIAFTDAVVLSPGIETIPDRADRCRLVAITNANYPYFSDSRLPTRAKQVRCDATVDDALRPPTSFAIAIADASSAGEEHVVAYANGCVPYPDEGKSDITITQIQGRHLKGRMGALFAGFDWKKTLVKAWMEFARTTPAETIGITGAASHMSAPSIGLLIAQAETGRKNPGWTAEQYREKGAERLAGILDRTADDMGFTYYPAGDYWELQLR